ncbi:MULTISPECIES: hypothetical protein [unclassified Pseudofrankia]|nr:MULTISPECIES: hypothetical protein [unclassified Pseudofrankia]MDT3444600.1 hypothetical protein [Pseudofrankia sp. BMG5.37]
MKSARSANEILDENDSHRSVPAPDEQLRLRALLTRAGADPSLFTCRAT